MKLTKFESEMSVNGARVTAQCDGNTLSLVGVRPEDLLLLLQHVEKFKTSGLVKPQAKGPKQWKRPELPAAATAPTMNGAAHKPDLKAVPKNGTTNGTVRTSTEPPLKTPAELRAEKETPKETKPVVAAAPQETPSKKEEPAAETKPVDKKEQFVEDLDVHQVVDQAARVASGEEPMPEALKKASNLRPVFSYFYEQRGLHSEADLLQACEAWRELVPSIKTVDPKALKARVKAAIDLWADQAD